MSRMIQLRGGLLETSVSALGWVSRRFGRAPEAPPHLVTGEAGELAAFFHLRGQGYVVVARRWNDGPGPGDLDLVAWQDDTLCFVEVKTRTGRNLATAEAAVDAQKRRMLRRMARQYLRRLPEDLGRPATRFDVVTVYMVPGEVREIRVNTGAFGWVDSRRDD